MKFHPTKVINNHEYQNGDTVCGELRMLNRECLEVLYMNDEGLVQTLIISTQGMVMLVKHKSTNACLLIGPGSIQFIEGTK